MAFWGIEVKPGKPYVHRYDDAHGRLHVSQATLDYGPSMKKSVVQCNIGNKAPILLCSLLPDKIESCSLCLEFEESVEVVFSVLGPRSVHLTGYYLGSGRRLNQDGDETDSYGEDIGDTETDKSNGTEDEYEDDFIDDGDLEVSPPSPLPTSRDDAKYHVSDSDGELPQVFRRRLKKKYHVSDSEADDNELAQVFQRHRKKKYHVSDSEANDSELPQVFMKHAGTFVLDSEDEDNIVLSSICKSEKDIKNLKTRDISEVESSGKVKKDKNVEDAFNEDLGLERMIECTEEGNNTEREAKQACDSFLSSSDVVVESGLKLKKKRKEKSVDREVIDKDVAILECDGKLKKKKRERAEALILQNGVDPSSGVIKKASCDNGTQSHNKEETKSEKIHQNLLSAAHESSLKHQDDDHIKGKRKKRKLKSKEIDATASREEIGLEMEEKNEFGDEMKDEAQLLDSMNLDGLHIEELAVGKPDGRIASHGNKVSIYYTGRLKENGNIFDSNIGQKPYKFRLGKGRVLQGWEVGIPGMRVGDKRRLIIPPSLGYGPNGAEEIPGNAWLIYEIELVNVR